MLRISRTSAIVDLARNTINVAVSTICSRARSFGAAILLPATLTLFAAVGAGSASAATNLTMSIVASPTHIAPSESSLITATITNVAGINCGTTTIQYQIYQDPSKVVLLTDWTTLDSGMPTNSVFTATFDGTAITVNSGELVQFRAKFNQGGAVASGGCGAPPLYNQFTYPSSPIADLLIDEVAGGICPNNQITGVFIAIEGPDGVGMPAPGDAGSWTFDVTITACEHVYNVSAQGGDNGWGTTKSCTPQANAGLGSTCEKRKTNNRNNVWLWQGGNLNDMDEGDTVTAKVTTDGTIKNKSSECGKIKILNGDWSALYAVTADGPKMKSEYSDYEAAIEVTCF